MGLWSSAKNFFLFIFIMAILGVLGMVGAYFAFTFMLQEKDIDVPKVIGMDSARAVTIMVAAGLQVRAIEDTYNPGMSPGEVVAQVPLPGTKVKKGRGVKLYRCAHTSELVVPDVSNIEVRKAEILLKQVGLETGRICRAYHDTVPAGNVISQSPPPNKGVPKEYKVNLLVSRGRQGVRTIMPNLIGLSLSDAKKTLNSMGFNFGITNKEAAAGEAIDTIVEQFPQQGEKVVAKQQVMITVAIGKKGGASATQAIAFDLPMPTGTGKVEVKVIDQTGIHIVYTGLHPKGGRLNVPGIVQKGASIIVTMDGQVIEHRTVGASE